MSLRASPRSAPRSSPLHGLWQPHALGQRVPSPHPSVPKEENPEFTLEGRAHGCKLAGGRFGHVPLLGDLSPVGPACDFLTSDFFTCDPHQLGVTPTLLAVTPYLCTPPLRVTPQPMTSCWV